MARDILDLGADVYDDTQETKKHRISPKKRNYIIGLSITGVFLAGAITFAVVASQLWLKDVTNLTNIQFYFTPKDESDEDAEDPTLTLYKLDPNTVYPATFRIPEKVQGYKVTAIAPDAFNGHSEIEKIIFTRYVDTVGDRAFYGCSGLKEVVWNEALVNIGSKAFEDTAFYNNLVNDPKGFLSIPSGLLLYVGADYFDDNTALVSDSITDDEKEAIKTKYAISDDDFYLFSDLKVSSFVAGLFKNNKKITYIDFPEFLKEIGADTFNGCTKLKGINFTHSNVTSLYARAFEGCTALADISFSDKLTTLGDDVFANTGIQSIPELHNITSIGSGIFKGCDSLTKVIYPASEAVTTVPEAMFENCTSLSEIYWGDEENSGIDYINKISYSAFKKTAFKTFKVPKNVSIIYDNTFSGCDDLETVSLYGNPTNKIDENSIPVDEEGNVTYDNFELSGYYEVNDDDSITIEFDEREELVVSPNASGNYVITIEDPSLDILVDEVTFTITAEQFATLPEADLSLVDSSKVFNLVIGGGFIDLMSATAYSIDNTGNYQLGYLVGVRDIRSYAFYNCTNLETINLYDDSNNITGEDGQFTFPNSLSLLNKDSYNGSENSNFDSTSATSIYFDSNVKAIGTYSFYGMRNLENVTFSTYSTLKSIGGGAFQNDDKLKAISLPSTVTSLGSSAFKGCTSLKTLEIGDTSIQTIRDEAFKDCSSLEHIDLPETVDSIRGSAFKGTTSLDYVVIPSGITQINANVFVECREEGEDKMPIYFEKTAKEFGLINIDANFHDTTAYYSLLLSENDTKIAGQAYWNGDKDNIQEILPTAVNTAGTLETTSYNAGDEFDPTGLTFTADYTDGVAITLDGDIDIVWDTLEAGDTSANGTYTVGNTVINIVVDGITVA